MRLIDADELIPLIKMGEMNTYDDLGRGRNGGIEFAVNRINQMPTIQPTLYGYNIKHLELIAIVLRKEGLPPERVAEALTDIGRIVAIVRDEFEETLRKAMQI